MHKSPCCCSVATGKEAGVCVCGASVGWARGCPSLCGWWWAKGTSWRGLKRGCAANLDWRKGDECLQLSKEKRGQQVPGPQYAAQDVAQACAAGAQREEDAGGVQGRAVEWACVVADDRRNVVGACGRTCAALCASARAIPRQRMLCFAHAQRTG